MSTSAKFISGILITAGMLLAGYATNRPEGKDRVKDLVCGMDVDPQSPNTYKTKLKGKTYYFCAEMCKKSFEANPEKYIQKKRQETVAAKDLVCGMDVDPRSPGTLKTVYAGQTYYFCADMCKKNFESNPQKYVMKKAAAAEIHAKPHTHAK